MKKSESEYFAVFLTAVLLVHVVLLSIPVSPAMSNEPAPLSTQIEMHEHHNHHHMIAETEEVCHQPVAQEPSKTDHCDKQTVDCCCPVINLHVSQHASSERLSLDYGRSFLVQPGSVDRVSPKKPPEV